MILDLYVVRLIKMQSQKNRFRFLEDVAIADIAFEAYGKDYSGLFENAANAIFELTVDLKTLKPKIKKEVKLENSKIDLLLYDFLSEILYIKDADGLIFCRCKIDIKGKNGKYILDAAFEGDKINPKTQTLENDIKAITMHMFKVEKTKNGVKAVVVVDI